MSACVCMHAWVHIHAPMAEGGRREKTCSVAKCLKGEAMSSRGPRVSMCAPVCVGVCLQWRAGRRTEPDSCAVQGSARVKGAMWHWSFLGRACSHMCVQTHPCVPAHSRSRDGPSGRQGIRLCLHFCCRERSFITRLCRDSVLLCMTLRERVVFF